MFDVNDYMKNGSCNCYMHVLQPKIANAQILCNHSRHDKKSIFVELPSNIVVKHSITFYPVLLSEESIFFKSSPCNVSPVSSPPVVSSAILPLIEHIMVTLMPYQINVLNVMMFTLAIK